MEKGLSAGRQEGGSVKKKNRRGKLMKKQEETGEENHGRFCLLITERHSITTFFYIPLYQRLPAMSGYKNYDIKDNDRFNPIIFPEVRDELDFLFSTVYLYTTPEKENIIISYLRDHSLHSYLLKDHCDLCHVLTEGKCPTGHIEALFDACRSNLQFLHSFEEYIRNIEVE